MGAQAVWCLGDSFHDREAAARIVPAVAARLHAQAAATRIVWIAGNHDGLAGGAWGGTVAEEMVVDGIVLRHQCRADEPRPEISGHFHPRSEEHTSELQSLMRISYAVFCLKKKTTTYMHTPTSLKK